VIARLVIVGAPRTKKNSQRVLRFGKFNKVVPSAAAMEWSDEAARQLREQWSGRAPIAGAVHVRAVFYREKNLGDLVGFMQALGDVLEQATPPKKAPKRAPRKPPAKAGVIENDRQIVSWDGTRLSKDAARPRVELEIMRVDA
jgi:hypothetical protein